jgi:2-amino-4-hydroxy-6-hydroxymethyldihydropteridine diphosphokinase
MKHIVYLALGTNLGDRLSNLKAAVNAMPPAVLPQAFSHIYETAPWGVTDQPDFLNQVIRTETELSPQDLLVYLKNLEKELGRTPAVRYGPRQIDIDILFYDDLMLETPELTIPHARLAERAFVLVPLADLAGDLRHPFLKKTARELLEGVDTSGVKEFEGEYDAS